MSDTATKPTLLEDLRSRAYALNAELDTLIDEREEGRTTFEALEGPSEDQRTAEQASEDEFRSSSEDKTAELESLNERVEQQTAKVERRKVAEESAIGEVTVKEPLIYREDNAHEFSYMKDLMATDQKVQQAMIGDSRAALERLHKHGRQMEERSAQAKLASKRLSGSSVAVWPTTAWRNANWFLRVSAAYRRTGHRARAGSSFRRNGKSTSTPRTCVREGSSLRSQGTCRYLPARMS